MNVCPIRPVALLALLVATLSLPHEAVSDPIRDEIISAMKEATAFMSEEVALHGGYVWVVSEDLTERWGEVRARPTQIWLQGGTEQVGQVMLDAWEATHDDYYLNVARSAADVIVDGQHPMGGWHYFVDFDPTELPEWYERHASKFRWGYEEYRYYYGNATFDDRVTQDAAGFLLRFYNVTKKAAYREPLLKALDFVLTAQYPNGAWPQRYPLRDDYAHDGFPDYTSFYTLNDGAAQANVELLLDAYEAFGDPRYFEAARLGVDALVELQGPEDQACWAEQYDLSNRPTAARTHEPAGYVVRESIGAMYLLGRFYLLTGDQKYLSPIPRCLDWFDRINRESAAEGYPRPRYWEPGTNRPLYVVRTEELTPEGYGVYLRTTDPSKTLCEGKPCQGDGKPLVDVAYLRGKFDEIAVLATPEERTAYHTEMMDSLSERPPHTESVEDILAALDERGAWVTDGIQVNEPNARTEEDAHPRIRGVSTRVFVSRISALIAALN